MSLGSYTYTPNGRRGIGLNQPQSGLDYPLVAPSEDIRYLMADLYLAYEDTGQFIVGPLRIKSLYGVGCAPELAPATSGIVIADAENRTVFDSSDLGPDGTYTRFSTWCWGLRKTSTACAPTYDYRVYEWIGNYGVCRLVTYQTWPESSDDSDADAARSYSVNLTPVSAVIDERAVYKMPKRITTLILPNIGSSGVTVTRSAVDFVAGLNTAITPADELIRGARRVSQITMDAIPGAGGGKYIDCEDSSPPVRSINGVGGPKIAIAAKDCLWSRTPTVVTPANKLLPAFPTDTHRLQLGSNCPACCTCADYVDLATYMNNTRNRYKLIGNDTNNVLLLHSDNIARWTDQRLCRLQEPIKVCMTAQRCPYLDIVAQYCNNCDACAKDVVLNMAFSSSTGSIAAVACGYTSITSGQGTANLFQVGGNWPNFTANIGNVDAGNSVTTRFRLQFSPARPASITASITGTSEGVPIRAGCSDSAPPAAAIAQRGLLCDDSGYTASLC